MKEVLLEDLIERYGKENAFTDVEAFSKRYRKLIEVNDTREAAWKMQSEIEEDEERYLQLTRAEQAITCRKVVHADDILADIIDDEMDEIYDPDIFEDIYHIWESSEDKMSLEMFFCRLLGVTFNEFLDKCEKQIVNESQEKLVKDIKRLYKKVCEEIPALKKRKVVTIVLEVKPDSEDTFSDEFIKRDIEQEINCTANDYRIVSFDIKKMETGDEEDHG